MQYCCYLLIDSDCEALRVLLSCCPAAGVLSPTPGWSHTQHLNTQSMTNAITAPYEGQVIISLRLHMHVRAGTTHCGTALDLTAIKIV
eukprot:COSAG02_NODE_5332_length_4430_cov_2.540753_4_plen_88_part_00